MSDRFVSIALIAVATLPAAAETVTDSNPLERVIVTATRTETPLRETLASVVIIDRDQIERSLAGDVAELLRFHAGLELGRNGGPGQTTSLFVRGTESNHALVLIDGVEINPGTLGAAALHNISPHNIQRIEIVKGPRSSLYGSEAIGGVVNIISRRDEGFSAQAGLGRDATREIALSAGKNWQAGSASLSVSRSSSDGFPTRVGADLPDRGYDNFSAGFNASLTAGASTVALRHWHSVGETEYFDFFLQPLTQDYLNRATALEWRLPATQQWNSSLSVSQIEDDIDQQQGNDYVRTRRDVAEWQNDLLLGQHAVVAGLYVAREKTESLSFGTRFDEDTDVNALFVEDVVKFGASQLLLAARYTDHESFDGHATYNAEFGHALTDALRLTLATGTGFRAPDATDRFGFGGNPDLEPEESLSFEAGLRGDWDAHTASLQWFQTDIDDLIEFVFDPVTFGGANLNVARARIRGLEARHDWRSGPWTISTTALVQDPEDRASGKQLARRSKRSLTVNLARTFGEHALGLDVLATSSRPDSPFSDISNAGYVLANLTGRLQLGANWRLQGRLENLLDRRYETAAGFRAADRGIYVSAHYRTR